MGEIADFVLSGGMCQGCGELLHDGDDGPGYPGWCEACLPEEKRPARSPLLPKRPRTIPCPGCSKLFNSFGAMKWHRKAKEH